MLTIRCNLSVMFIAVMSLLLIATSATAGTYSYENLDAGTVIFSNIVEESTTDTGPLYGQPLYFGNNQLFFPTNFVSTATDGASDSTNGDLSMTISAADGFAIQTIVISEYGNYNLTGDGTLATQASITSSYTVDNLNGTIGFSPGGTFSLPSDTGGSFSGAVSLDFSGLGITELDFLLINDLFTTSEVGTTATIQKNLLQDQVMVEIYTSPIPIPGAVWLLGSGLLAVAGFRRRK